MTESISTHRISEVVCFHSHTHAHRLFLGSLAKTQPGRANHGLPHVVRETIIRQQRANSLGATVNPLLDTRDGGDGEPVALLSGRIVKSLGSDHGDKRIPPQKQPGSRITRTIELVL